MKAIKTLTTFLSFSIVLLCLLSCQDLGTKGKPQLQPAKGYYSEKTFEFQTISGIGHEPGCTRRDPSDVIKVGSKYYVYYTKVYGRSPGYWGTIWYATSTDEGLSWEEKGEILGLGNEGMFDSQATFTPNIIFANGKYYMYYTGVKPTPGRADGVFENNSTTDITAIGLAISESPNGPFVRYKETPVLEISKQEEKFDSYRIDDAALLFKDNKYWLYYKGRCFLDGAGGPGKTKMGVAFADKPEGPFEKYGEPILSDSHEVMVWPHGNGVAALASKSKTFEYAPDGLDFYTNKLGIKQVKIPQAPGAFRADLTKPEGVPHPLEWGISMVHNGDEAYLIRYELSCNIIRDE